MTKYPSILKPLLITSYVLVFISGLGAFSSSMGCVLQKKTQATVSKETIAKPRMRLMNPMQTLTARFFN